MAENQVVTSKGMNKKWRNLKHTHNQFARPQKVESMD